MSEKTRKLMTGAQKAKIPPFFLSGLQAVFGR